MPQDEPWGIPTLILATRGDHWLPLAGDLPGRRSAAGVCVRAVGLLHRGRLGRRADLDLGRLPGGGVEQRDHRVAGGVGLDVLEHGVVLSVAVVVERRVQCTRPTKYTIRSGTPSPEYAHQTMECVRL